MSYCFQHRFKFALPGSLDLPEEKYMLEDDLGGQGRVWLASVVNGQPLKESSEAVIGGADFTSEEEARRTAETWRGALERSFAAVQLGVDFGDRAPQSAFGEAFRAELETKYGRPFLNNVHGLLTFQCQPRPVLVGGSGGGLRVVVRESWERALQAASHEAPPTPEYRLAYDIYSAAFFVRKSPDARFMLLMMALETLIDERERDPVTREHVRQLVRLTEAADLPMAEKESVLGTLRSLQRQSISQAGRSLADTLGEKRYGGRSPRRFFDDCYKVRSRLVHGGVPRPSRQEVGRLAAHMEAFVGHLLAGPDVTAAAVRAAP